MINGNYPIETAFMSNSDKARRDSLKPNRIYFKLPETWFNSKNNSVIGIRNLFIAKSFKYIKMSIDYSLVKTTIDLSDESSSSTTLYTNSLKIEKRFDDETLLKNLISDIKTEMSEITIPENNFTLASDNNPGLTNQQYTEIQNTDILDVYFEYVVDANGNHGNVVEFTSPFNTLGAFKKYTDTTNNLEIEYSISFQVSLQSADAMEMFKNRTESYNYITYKDVWDRNSCIVYSNIAEQADSGYLGHTRRQSIPTIKYYKLNGTRNEFWIELYSTCDHKAPVILPQSDELIIEAQLL